MPRRLPLLVTVATLLALALAAPVSATSGRRAADDLHRNSGPAVAAPGTAPVNGGWVPFDFGAPGTVGYTARYSASAEVWLRVTDAFCAGDEFLVLRDGITLGNTSHSTGETCDDYTDSPRRAEVGPQWSSGGWLLPAGRHVITVITSRSDIGGGSGIVRLDSPAVATGRMTGAAEEPGPGDPDGTGRVAVNLLRQPRTICYSLAVGEVGTIMAGHIQRGVRGVAGPVVLNLDLAPGEAGQQARCLPAPRAVIDAIAYAAWRYYVNVHTTQYPSGAVRGQLAPPY